jgi:hypothetical protein
VIVPTIVSVMGGTWIVTGIGRLGLVGPTSGIESGRVEPADREQDLQGYVAAACLDEPVAMEPVVEPRLDLLDLVPGDEIDLVEDEHVGERDLAELQLHQLRRREDLVGVDDAHDAVQPDASRICCSTSIGSAFMRPPSESGLE